MDTYPELAKHLTVEAYLDQREVMQDELWRTVQPMAGAVELIELLVSLSILALDQLGERADAMNYSYVGGSVLRLWPLADLVPLHSSCQCGSPNSNRIKSPSPSLPALTSPPSEQKPLISHISSPISNLPTFSPPIPNKSLLVEGNLARIYSWLLRGVWEERWGVERNQKMRRRGRRERRDWSLRMRCWCVSPTWEYMILSLMGMRCDIHTDRLLGFVSSHRGYKLGSELV